MSKEAIVEKIISDAHLRAESIIGEANAKADEVISVAAEECKAYLYNFKAETDKMVFDVEARSKTVAELDAKKLTLAAKTKVLDVVYERALDNLRNLDKDTYSELIFAMLQNAKDGDVVTISQREKDIVTTESLAQFAKEKGIFLTLSDKLGDFDGGVILSENGVDKNFTFEIEVALLKEQTEANVAKEIFG